MTPRLIDTHAHVNFNAFREDGDEVVKRALEQGVGMILVGSQRDTSKRAVEYAEKYLDEPVWAAVGLHPTHLVEHIVDTQEIGAVPADASWKKFESREEVFDLEYYRALAQSPKVVAIGEFGLDYHRLSTHGSLSDQTDIQLRTGLVGKQKEAARGQLELAMELQKPVLLHCRNAHHDLQKLVDAVTQEAPTILLKRSQKKYSNGLKATVKKTTGNRSPRGVVHSFTGTIEEAEQWLKRDFLIAFNGIITFAPELEAVVKFVPLEKMVVETDSPYLAPVPFRGKRNEPLYVEYVARKIAEMKGVDFEEVAQKTTRNARKLTVGG